MAKRKRDTKEDHCSQTPVRKKHTPFAKSQTGPPRTSKRNVSKSLQIITGSYDRVLHGIIATLPKSLNNGDEASQEVQFKDNFLFNAHHSAIRCLAVSPASQSENASESQKLILASGSTDERINLYHISASVSPMASADGRLPAALNSMTTLENPKNKELGSLLHHSSNVNVLHFPTRSKLLSGAEDNTIAISRTRDWTVLSTIKAPVPTAVGRPSGDTAPLGGTPAGVNDFAVHPSMKLMISVGKGEKCMRLWNLVTGKKAGVLSFDRPLLQAAGEGKWSSGEGRKVVWNRAGDSFVVGFERGAIVFAMDSKPKGRIASSPVSKLHQMRYCSQTEDSPELLVVSTEDGRMIFFSSSTPNLSEESSAVSAIPIYEVIGELGGKRCGLQGRIKDFEILTQLGTDGSPGYLIVTAGSDGSIRLWRLDEAELTRCNSALDPASTAENGAIMEGLENGVSQNGTSTSEARQLGRLFGTYATSNRITCMKAFMLLEAAEDEDQVVQGDVERDSEVEFNGLD